MIEQIKELRARTNVSMIDCKKALLQSKGNIESAIDLLKQWGALKSQAKSNLATSEGRVLASVDLMTNIGAIVEINCQTDFNSKSDEFIRFCSNYLEHYSNVDDVVKDYAKNMEEQRHMLISQTNENVVIRRQDRWCQEDNRMIFMSAYNHHNGKFAALVKFTLDNDKLRDDKEFQEFTADIAMQTVSSCPLVVNKNEIPQTMTERQTKIFEAQVLEIMAIRKFSSEDQRQLSKTNMLNGKLYKWHQEVALLEQEYIKDNKKKIGQVLEERFPGVKIEQFIRYELGEKL